MCGKMSMYRSYLLKNNFWAKKGNEKLSGTEKVFIKHDSEVGGIYAVIENDKKGRYRISTHPDFITYNKEKLLNHQDSQIRELAEELPNNDK